MPDGERRRPRSQDWSGLSELEEEVRTLRRANDKGRRPPAPTALKPSGSRRHRPAPVRTYRARRRRRLGLFVTVAGLIVLVVAVTGALGGSSSFPAPSGVSLAGLSARDRIVKIAGSQVGYSTNPSSTYCNKFSAYWGVGNPGCAPGLRSEQWCADFAAWAWRKAGVDFSYSYTPGDINAGAASFYRWGVAHGEWHPVTSGYKPQPGDVAVYGLRLTGYLTAAHVAVVTGFQPGNQGPDVVNGDGDRSGFSVVESGADQVRADTSHHQDSTLSGYVSPP